MLAAIAVRWTNIGPEGVLPNKHEGSGERRGRIQVADGWCPSCEQRHTLDIEYRCVGCDGGVCALCVVVVRERQEAWCPECAPEAG